MWRVLYNGYPCGVERRPMATSPASARGDPEASCRHSVWAATSVRSSVGTIAATRALAVAARALVAITTCLRTGLCEDLDQMFPPPGLSCW